MRYVLLPTLRSNDHDLSTAHQKLPTSLVHDEEGRILHYTTTNDHVDKADAPTNYITAAPYAFTAYFTDPTK